MERIQVYKINPIINFVSKAFAVLYLVWGVWGLISLYFTPGKKTFLGGQISFFGYIIQGILFFALVYSNLKKGRYFIEWDDRQIRYLLNHDRQVNTIQISEITGVSIKLYEIILQLTKTERTLHIELIQYKDIKRIKEKFEEIKENNELKNP